MQIKSRTSAEFVLAVGLMLLAAGCATGQRAVPSHPVKSAMAELYDASGKAMGKVRFDQGVEGIVIAIEATGLPGGQKLAFHIHETGSCVGPDFKSAGGHFNPAHKGHGHKNPKGAHAGDLPNLKIAKDGHVRYETLSTDISLDPSQASSIVRSGGTSVVIHAGSDDEKSDPAGNAGNRIACGVIVAGK